MKKRLKQRLSLTALLLALVLMVSAAASGLLTRTQLDAYTGVTVVLDGEVIDYTYDNGTKPDAFLVDGVTYLPVRAISEALGLDVEWDGSSATVTLTSSGELFADLAGTYDELFTVICDPKYDQIWLDSCAAIVGAENAPMYAELLKSACTGTIYGQEAVDAYGDGSNGAQFDCYFINGISQFTFEGNTISGTDKNGRTVFSHEYKDAGPFSLGGLMDGELYETDDADAGEFRYFLMMPDTPATTWHIEFRYGSSKDDLALYNAGPYAYWLAAGILADRDEQTVKDVINLFCTENLAGEEAEEDVYVLMNIPYAEFYAAEGAVDAISSATLNGKARNVNVNGASYHQSEEAVTTEGIAGAMYPVKATAADLEALKALGAVEVTDADNIHYELEARGNISEVDLTGALALQESPSYSYYVLSEAPASYKELTVADGKVSFGAVVGQAASAQASGTVSYTGHHTDIEISMEGIKVEAPDVSAVIVTMDNGTAYAMHHVVNIWRGNELGWDLSDLDLGGQTITGVRYMLKNGEITDYAVNIPILPAYNGELTGSVSADKAAFTLAGPVADLENAVLTVNCTVGSGRGVPSGTVYAGPAAGTVSLDQAVIADLIAQGEAGAEVTFTATVASDNYATIVVTIG